MVGEIRHALFIAAAVLVAFGTGLLAWSASSCRGSNSATSASRRPTARNWSMARMMRRAPAADRASCSHVRKNYFRLYFHYMYFNIFRSLLSAGRQHFRATSSSCRPSSTGTVGFTLGIMQQILTAFGQVSNSFQFLINSWTTIVELLSIYKRLNAFEAVFRGQELAEIERNYLAREGGGFVQPVPNPSPGEGGPDAVQTLEDPKRP
jgi:peptide/bleomycin uptake transporter